MLEYSELSCVSVVHSEWHGLVVIVLVYSVCCCLLSVLRDELFWYVNKEKHVTYGVVVVVPDQLSAVLRRQLLFEDDRDHH